MRVVLDTNVLVSGVLSAAGWIVEAVLAGRLELALDARIRAEYEDVLRRPEFAFSPERIADLLEAIDRFAFQVAAVEPWPAPLPDRDDEPWLAVAGATGSVLVTGNLKHFPARARRGVLVQAPREFIEYLRNEA